MTKPNHALFTYLIDSLSLSSALTSSLSLSPIYHAETVSSSRNLLVAAYTLYYHTTPAVETHLLQRYTHHVMTSVCTPVLFDNYLSFQPFVAFYTL